MDKLFLGITFIAAIINCSGALKMTVNFDFVNAFEEFQNDASAFTFSNVLLSAANEQQKGQCSAGIGKTTYCIFKFSDGVKFGQRGETNTMDVSFELVEKKSGKVKKNGHQLYYFSPEEKIVVFINGMDVSFVTYIGPRGRNYYNYQ